jgi:hypothetical protein
MAVKELEIVKEKMRNLKPMTPWDEIKVGYGYHIPPIKSLGRKDVVILTKTDKQVVCERLHETPKKEITIANSSVYAKLMVRKRGF